MDPSRSLAPAQPRPGCRVPGGLVSALPALAALLGALTAPALAAQSGAPSLHRLAFMAGAWCSPDRPGEASIEERYTPPTDNLILGTTRYVRDGRTLSHEFTRIERRDGGVVLTAMPSGQTPVDFPLTAVAVDSAVFANPDHDFPSRITYTGGGGGRSLTARIEGSGGRSASWTMTPCSDGAVLESVAFRVHRMAEMEAFYTAAFGAEFRDASAGSLTIREGRVGDVVLRLVPIRDAPDFSGFPVHQPGFVVDDIEAVVALARAHGGRLEGEPVVSDGVMERAAIRDPDGNTVELRRKRP